MGEEASEELGRPKSLSADPFDLPLAVPEVPRIDPLTPPDRRRALVAELRGLVARDEYHVEADIVALAVMNAEGVMIPSGGDE